MAKNDSTRARARREVAVVRDRKRAEQKAKEARIDKAAIEYAMGMEQVRQGEVRCGRAIESLYDEGLTATEVAEWCGGVSVAELRRLRQLASFEDDPTEAVGLSGHSSSQPEAEAER